MTTAYILINCDLGSEADIIKKIKKLPNVLDVTHVSGVYDIIVRISSDNVEDLRETIKQNIKKIEKVRSTITMVVTDRPGHIKWYKRSLIKLYSAITWIDGYVDIDLNV